MEEQVLGAEERRVALEYEIFARLRRRIAAEFQRIKGTGERIAQIDVHAPYIHWLSRLLEQHAPLHQRHRQCRELSGRHRARRRK